MTAPATLMAAPRATPTSPIGSAASPASTTATTVRHPHSIALARLLLDAGADPNDGQTLYNRMFRADDDHLELLVAYGLGRGDGGEWMARLGPDAPDTPAELLAKQFRWAISHGFTRARR